MNKKKNRLRMTGPDLPVGVEPVGSKRKLRQIKKTRGRVIDTAQIEDTQSHADPPEVAESADNASGGPPLLPPLPEADPTGDRLVDAPSPTNGSEAPSPQNPAEDRSTPEFASPQTRKQPESRERPNGILGWKNWFKWRAKEASEEPPEAEKGELDLAELLRQRMQEEEKKIPRHKRLAIWTIDWISGARAQKKSIDELRASRKKLKQEYEVAAQAFAKAVGEYLAKEDQVTDAQKKAEDKGVWRGIVRWWYRLSFQWAKERKQKQKRETDKAQADTERREAKAEIARTKFLFEEAEKAMNLGFNPLSPDPHDHNLQENPRDLPNLFHEASLTHAQTLEGLRETQAILALPCLKNLWRFNQKQRENQAEGQRALQRDLPNIQNDADQAYWRMSLFREQILQTIGVETPPRPPQAPPLTTAEPTEVPPPAPVGPPPLENRETTESFTLDQYCSAIEALRSYPDGYLVVSDLQSRCSLSEGETNAILAHMRARDIVFERDPDTWGIVPSRINPNTLSQAIRLLADQDQITAEQLVDEGIAGDEGEAQEVMEYLENADFVDFSGDRIEANFPGATDTPTQIETDELPPEDEALLERCIEIIATEQKASTALLQRRLRLGFNRAQRMIDILEARGVIGPAEEARPRDVLIPRPENAPTAPPPLEEIPPPEQLPPPEPVGEPWALDNEPLSIAGQIVDVWEGSAMQRKCIEVMGFGQMILEKGKGTGLEWLAKIPDWRKGRDESNNESPT